MTEQNARIYSYADGGPTFRLAITLDDFDVPEGRVPFWYEATTAPEADLMALTALLISDGASPLPDQIAVTRDTLVNTWRRAKALPSIYDHENVGGGLGVGKWARGIPVDMPVPKAHPQVGEPA